MKRIICSLLVTCLVATSLNAQVTENFNTRNGVALTQLKGYLQSHCWTLPDFEITGFNTETDGWLVPGGPISTNQRTGIYTPALDIAENVTISFNSQSNLAFEKGARRWLKLSLTDPN